jgi:thiol-disulfide isomerase/thioredoxin
MKTSPLRPLAIALWIAVFVFAGILAANRWLGTGDGEETAETAGAPSTANEAPEYLPEFTLADLRGDPRSSRDWAGRTVLFNFWATWCAPCRREMPLLEQFAQEQGTDGVAVVGIAIDRSEPVLRFVGETGVTYPILVGQMDATRVAESFGDAFRALPFSVVAAPDGMILAIHTGELHAPDLARMAEVAAALKAGTLDSAQARERLRLGAAETKAPDDAGSGGPG